MQTLAENQKFQSALDYASGSADRNGAIVDTAEYEGLLLLVHFAAIADAAVLSIKAQHGDAADGSDMTTIAETNRVIPGTADNQVFGLDIYRPRKRYVRLLVDKDATNVTAESAQYVLYGPKTAPVTNANIALHLSPGP